MNKTEMAPPRPLWIVGYGNHHRRDDGLGLEATRRLLMGFGRSLSVRILGVHQLEPELAEDLQDASMIVFIDASVVPMPGGFAWERVRPGPVRLDRLTHGMVPSDLLGLIQWLYGDPPPAWLVSVQGADFGFGEGLSSCAEAGLQRAVAAVTQVVNRRLRPHTADAVIETRGAIYRLSHCL